MDLSNTVIEENYLKAMFSLSPHHGTFSTTELSQAMEVSLPTANSMVKNLSNKGFLHYLKYKPLRLTNEGYSKAALIVRRHRLTEMYLSKKMGFGWEEVHALAEYIEHLPSEKFFDRMDEILDFPQVDPHGSPIPDKEGNIQWTTYEKLSDVSQGASVKLSGLLHSSQSFLSFLNEKKIALGMVLEIKFIEPFDQSMTISFNDTEVVLSKEVGERLLVQRIN